MSYRETDTISLSAKELVAFLLRQGMSREALLRALEEVAPENASDNSFPSLTLAADLIPEYTDKDGNKRKWEIVSDVAPSAFQIGDLKFLSFLKKNKNSVTGKTMCQRAVVMKGNLGLADAKRFLAEQEKIPQRLRGLYIVFPGTVLRDSYGRLDVADLRWDRGRWSLRWSWLGGDWSVRDRFACSE